MRTSPLRMSKYRLAQRHRDERGSCLRPRSRRRVTLAFPPSIRRIARTALGISRTSPATSAPCGISDTVVKHNTTDSAATAEDGAMARQMHSHAARAAAFATDQNRCSSNRLQTLRIDLETTVQTNRRRSRSVRARLRDFSFASASINTGSTSSTQSFLRFRPAGCIDSVRCQWLRAGCGIFDLRRAAAARKMDRCKHC